MAIANLPAEERFKPDNIFFPVCARASVYKQHGMARVLCGVDSEGVQHDEPCYAADMRELDAGVEMTIPDDKAGGVMTVRVFCWDIVGAFDYLAKQSVRPFYESTGAHQFCGDCDFDSSTPLANKPFSFLRRRAPTPGSAKSPTPKVFELRNFQRLMDELAKARKATTKTARDSYMKTFGFNTLHYAWDPLYIPFVDPACVPQDILHLFPDGLLRSEGAWLFYIFLNLGLSLDRVNAAIRSYPRFPSDVRIPPLLPNLQEGIAGGRPRRAATLRMSGSQVMHFALHRCVCSRKFLFL